MLAGGTGITPFYQILQAANLHKDITEFTLIFGNKTSADILLFEELQKMKNENNFTFNLHFLIDKDENDWKGLVGYVSKDMIEKYFPPASEDTILLMCGPPVMCKVGLKVFAELNHDKNNIFEF